MWSITLQSVPTHPDKVSQMRQLLCILFLLLFTASCAGQFPQCNDKYSQDALLTQIAITHGICLDDLGTQLIIANGINISFAELYTAEQALSAVNKWIEVLQEPIVAFDFKVLVMDSLKDFPELIELTLAFDRGFHTISPIDEDSRLMLKSYLEKRVKPILEIRIKNK